MKRYLSVKVKVVVGILLAVFCGGVYASSGEVLLKSFKSDSLFDITSAKSDQPFMLLLWSIDCPPCIRELSLVSDFQHQLSKENIVLISTDGPESTSVVQQALADHGLGQLDNWIFSGDMPERLRYEIDPEWYGELPRTYFYLRENQREAHSGMLTEKILTQWLRFSQSKHLQVSE